MLPSNVKGSLIKPTLNYRVSCTHFMTEAHYHLHAFHINHLIVFKYRSKAWSSLICNILVSTIPFGSSFMQKMTVACCIIFAFCIVGLVVITHSYHAPYARIQRMQDPFARMALGPRPTLATVQAKALPFFLAPQRSCSWRITRVIRTGLASVIKVVGAPYPPPSPLQQVYWIEGVETLDRARTVSCHIHRHCLCLYSGGVVIDATTGSMLFRYSGPVR